MHNSTIFANECQNQAYGFLCQKTNVFYAFESYETYTQFLEWLEQENILAGEETIRNEAETRDPCISED